MTNIDRNIPKNNIPYTTASQSTSSAAKTSQQDDDVDVAAPHTLYTDALFKNCIDGIEELYKNIEQSRKECLFDSITDSEHTQLQSAVGKLQDTHKQYEEFINKCDEVAPASDGIQTSDYQIMITPTKRLSGMIGMMLAAIQVVTDKSKHAMTIAASEAAEAQALNQQAGMEGDMNKYLTALYTNMTKSDNEGKQKDLDGKNTTATPLKTLEGYKNGNNTIISNADEFKGTPLYDLFTNFNGDKTTAEINSDKLKNFLNDLGNKIFGALTPDQGENKWMQNAGTYMFSLTSNGLQAYNSQWNSFKQQIDSKLGQFGQRMTQVNDQLQLFLQNVQKELRGAMIGN